MNIRVSKKPPICFGFFFHSALCCYAIMFRLRRRQFKYCTYASVWMSLAHQLPHLQLSRIWVICNYLNLKYLQLSQLKIFATISNLNYLNLQLSQISQLSTISNLNYLKLNYLKSELTISTPNYLKAELSQIWTFSNLNYLNSQLSQLATSIYSQSDAHYVICCHWGAEWRLVCIVAPSVCCYFHFGSDHRIGHSVHRFAPLWR